MMQIKVKPDFVDVQKMLGAAAKQVRFASALALTKTAVDAREELRRVLPTIIDRPTRYTMSSMYVRKAKPSQLDAIVGFKDGYQNAPDESKHYLVALIRGGQRRTKRFEGRLIMTGKLSRGEHLVPTRLADIDQHGNVSRGQITKILSQLKTAVVQGDNSNASNSKRSKAKRAIEEYFWSPGPGHYITYVKKGRVVSAKTHLKKGVWMVRRTAFGNAVRPIFYAVPRTSYQKTFDLPGIVDRVQRLRFGENFKAAFDQAMKTAR